MKDVKYVNFSLYIDKFNPYWSKFQDTWDDEMWREYNKIRNITTTAEVNEIEEEINIKSNKNETLEMIDKEIENLTSKVNEEDLENPEDQNRSCFRNCEIF